MSIRTLVLLLIFIYSDCPVHSQGSKIAPKFRNNYSVKNIVIEARLNISHAKDSIKIAYGPVNAIGINRPWQNIQQKITEGKAILHCEADEVMLLMMPFLDEPYYQWLAEPGDSIVVSVNAHDIRFSGRGSEKFNLQYDILQAKRTLKMPTDGPILLTHFQSFNDYLSWMRWMDEYERQFTALINNYRGKIAEPILNRINDRSGESIISRLKDVFSRLSALAGKDNFKKITIDDLCAVYDSTVLTRINKWLPYSTDGFIGTWTIIKTLVQRKYRYRNDLEPLNSELKRALCYYEEGLKLYKDKPLSREQFLVRLFTEEMLDDIGYRLEIANLLEKYYSEPGYPEHKKYVMDYELRKRKLHVGAAAPAFTLTDIEGKPFTSEKLKGKIVFIDFWFTGCKGCIDMVPVLKRIEAKFKGDTNLIFLNVSIDRDMEKWKKSILEKKYTTGEGISLYTNGRGDEDYMIKAFMINGYPALYLLDTDFRVVQNPLPDPRLDNGDRIISIINTKRARFKDGPYVLHDDDKMTAYSVDGKVLSSTTIGRLDSLTVQTDTYEKTFAVSLSPGLRTEPSDFASPEKLLAISDIEGNFDALRKLLQSNGVINDQYNWTFGKGHLVINGDVFDRGHQVTECLWLIYSLEEKAKAAGGYVHFILGNHEIMNLSGNHKYARSKYRQSSELLGKKYAELFGLDSELGRWLRTKNIMEKIGDLLFVHAGISHQINDLPLTIAQINELARPYYDKDSIARRSNNKQLSLLYESKDQLSPFWCRQYYQDVPVKKMINTSTLETFILYKASAKQVDQTLKKFGVSRIITGHTIVKPGDKPTLHYENKVINIDTHHAEGKSAGLLVEGKSFYQVNTNGIKTLLFKTD